ncbi:hypothetical protein ACWDSJ_03160, partial [Nocardia sp. NPDC003482]
VGHRMICPPSTLRMCPVTQPASSESRYRPAAATPPAGTVTPAAPIAALLTDPDGGPLAALDTDGRTVRLGDDPATARAVPLPAPATGWSPGAPGEILLTAGNQLLHLNRATGELRATALDAPARAVARRPDGTVAVGLADGRVRILAADDTVRDTVTGLGEIDALAAAGDAVAVLDRSQTTLTELDLTEHRARLALRAGQGASALIGDHFGRLLVSDTSGGALLVYTADPLVLRQRFPVGSSPYALAYDRRTETVWVTRSGGNEVLGYDLSRGIPEEVDRLPTVRQPNSVAIDDRTGEMFVGSATGDGLQRIGADQRKRGQG